jgi:hypothetical protein
MPKRDGTGPYENGPMSGRGEGICIIPLNKSSEELDFLKTRERALKQHLQYIRSRIKTITAEAKKKESLP